uniref:Uncharacterized protein n=1 Tax=Anguilla anguilla TaxID=7936 RepID=A0A0E9XAG3_ANGAN
MSFQNIGSRTFCTKHSLKYSDLKHLFTFFCRALNTNVTAESGGI